MINLANLTLGIFKFVIVIALCILAVYGSVWTYQHLPNVVDVFTFFTDNVDKVTGKDAEVSGATHIVKLFIAMLLFVLIPLGYLAVYALEWGILWGLGTALCSSGNFDMLKTEENESNKNWRCVNIPENPRLSKGPQPIPDSIPNKNKPKIDVNKPKEVKQPKPQKQKVQKPEPVEEYVPPTSEEMELMRQEELSFRLQMMEEQNRQLLDSLNDIRRNMSMQQEEFRRYKNETPLDKFSKWGAGEQIAAMIIGKKAWDKLSEK